MMNARVVFKIADTQDEFEAIHELNYRTFVEEIPQHAPSVQRRLVDKFHAENIYLIARAGSQLVGMVALRDRRPFSLDAKLANLDKHLSPKQRWAEVRLLAIEPAWRGSSVFVGLMRLLEQVSKVRGLDAAVVSAATSQRRLYDHLGFESFGPLVGRENAWYQPMRVRIGQFQKALASHRRRRSVNLLPGPVTVLPAVRRAFQKEPVSHRSQRQISLVAECRTALKSLTGASHAALVPGGGTTANEVVASWIALLDAPGVVASNGEFGERLADHARRASIPHSHWRLAWGDTIDPALLSAFLDLHPEARWLWMTHCETSTGAFNQIEPLLAVCKPRGIKLCLDCVSSLGVVPVNLERVHLAAGSSGKGLGAFAGLGIVFHCDPVSPVPERVPRALDLSLYSGNEGIPFTLSSNLVAALHTALHQTDWQRKFARISALGAGLHEDLRAQGVALADPSAPFVFTVTLPDYVDSLAAADAIEAAGWLVAARSCYLRQRNWLQLCLMGEIDEPGLEGLVATLADVCGTVAGE